MKRIIYTLLILAVCGCASKRGIVPAVETHERTHTEDNARIHAERDSTHIVDSVRERTIHDTVYIEHIWKEYHDFYASKTKEELREDGRLWQTVHGVVYDLDNLTMQLAVQENDNTEMMTFDCFKSLPASKGDLGNIDLSSVAKIGTAADGQPATPAWDECTDDFKRKWEEEHPQPEPQEQEEQV